ncbi:m-AAA protease-interacting protein 1, mitochondrial isoform X2 [Megalops cyprinoides]|uniref:m-AAA protease-interacting protein 1, mitochondrial isoform X2 n=1 Tax=Megalops cyprinoides TaxID=118141 RepID=UPI0018654A18|nr:m-AAA protease-interacting protein 1, mitochondrial isoform X2 [Megalops cyprinoides]
MALPVLRSCCARPPTLLTRILRPERSVLVRPANRNLTPVPPVLSSGRLFSSHRDGESKKQTQKVVVVGIPNPFIWFRTRIYYFLIRAYFDKEFNIEEFTDGAKQAFSHVSQLLSRSQFEALDGLVAKDLIGKLEEKCNNLPPGHREALSAEPDEIMYTTPGDVGIYYDDSGRKFVSILMRFWYLTSAKLPEDSLEGTRVFQVAIGGEGEAETKRLLTANYEFQREFTKGVPPDWTITRIEHSKLLD